MSPPARKNAFIVRENLFTAPEPDAIGRCGDRIVQHNTEIAVRGDDDSRNARCCEACTKPSATPTSRLLLRVR
jgi:hypothetical protein